MSLASNAQSKNERQVMSNAVLLENTVFGTKYSATLELLFAKTLHYEHSNGHVETREQAMDGLTHNKSTYVKSEESSAYQVKKDGDSLIVDHPFKAIEKKADGAEVQLDFMVTTVWIKENGSWKLSRRKATKK